MSLSARNWAWRQRAIWDAQRQAWVPMNHGDKLVLLCLGEHVNLEQRVAYPGVARIAEWCCMSERAVGGHLKRLELGGLIVRSRRRAWGGQWVQNEYELRLSESDWAADDSYREEHNMPALDGTPF